MSQFLDRLNLRPQERRILVVVTTVVLIVLNALFVWPYFKDWSRLKVETSKARETLKSYRDEVAKTSEYQSRLEKLEGQGSTVLPAEQALQLMRTVQNQAAQSSVPITSTRSVAASGATSTNVFFDEQTVVIGVSTGDKELVEFLLALGAGSSMIRVRDLDLRPDPPQYKLNGNITLIASYQKKPKAASSEAKPGAKNTSPTKKKT